MTTLYIAIGIAVVVAIVVVALVYGVTRLHRHTQLNRRREAARWEAFTAVGKHGTVLGLQLTYRGADGPTFFERETATTLNNKEEDYQEQVEMNEAHLSRTASEYNSRGYRHMTIKVN